MWAWRAFYELDGEGKKRGCASCPSVSLLKSDIFGNTKNMRNPNAHFFQDFYQKNCLLLSRAKQETLKQLAKGISRSIRSLAEKDSCLCFSCATDHRAIVSSTAGDVTVIRGRVTKRKIVFSRNVPV